VTRHLKAHSKPGATPRLGAAAASSLFAGLFMSFCPLYAAETAPSPERYRIQDGDTLSAISQRLFGDAKYWPRLHAWNQASIRDPNLIRPGNWVVFTQGTQAALPSVAVAAPPPPARPQGSSLKPSVASDPSQDRIATSSARSRRRADEWKHLPPQRWESIIPKLPDNVDEQGFDRSNKIFFKQTRGFELDAFAASEKVAPLGQIVASRVGAQYLTLGDTVYIRPDGEQLSVGETYSITQDPYKLKSAKSDRDGYSYRILGQVKIIAVRDELMIGTIVAGKDLIPRGADLISVPPRVPQLSPIPGPAAVEGRVLLDRNLATYTTAQHKLAFINRGSADGVQPGMIFRAYEHYDPANDKKITSADFIVDADVMVVHVTDHFSTALVLRSELTIVEDAPVTLLMDVSDLITRYGFGEVLPGEKKRANELDELDGVGDGLNPDERRELEQLERWKGNPSDQPAGETPELPPIDATPAPEETPAAAPSTEETPPPPIPTEELPPMPAPETTESLAPMDADSAATAPPTPAPEAPETAPPPTSQESKDLDRLLDQ
jgi:hypothetical protein